MDSRRGIFECMKKKQGGNHLRKKIYAQFGIRRIDQASTRKEHARVRGKAKVKKADQCPFIYLVGKPKVNHDLNVLQYGDFLELLDARDKRIATHGPPPIRFRARGRRTTRAITRVSLGRRRACSARGAD
ncbi:unnamed protein product [Cyprideis torosa]|uniref:Uncharacterized protein n=1 Tax=Cyprideis torosa TaxID=163714 RepID=A0A7R8ZQ67_9CRUS|nr:unnamed protein product [Cyprideis torosa]CAG0891409.1 unnamed protein product [Cyprideis torosa]